MDSIKTNITTRRPKSFSISKINNKSQIIILCKTYRALQILPRKSKFTLTQSAQAIIIIIIMISVMGFHIANLPKAVATDNLTGRNIA